MPDFNDIPTGLRVPSQIPLDIKEYFATLADMLDLGANNNKAFTYYKGFRAYCVENDSIYVWKEAVPELGPGLLPSNFTYPNGAECFGVDYSNKQYNFFLKPETLNLASVGSGAKVYKGYNDLLNRHEFRSIVSDTLELSEEQNEIRINTPTSTYNLSFYVDIYSTANDETGSLSAPFKTLNKALDAFIGTGTWFDPQYKGYKITMLSPCNLLEAPGADYNGYINLDINHLNIEGNDFYLGLYSNPSPDYYPISTRRMVLNMPKTANVLDYPIEMRFNNITFQRLKTNAIVDNLNYSFPTATLVDPFPPQQNGVNLWFTNCTFTNDSARLPSPDWSAVSNPNDGGNPLVMFGIPVHASNSEPWGVPMIKTEGRNWNKEGGFRLGNSKLVNLSGTAIKATNTTYNDYYEHNTISLHHYFRFYESEVDDYYSPKLGAYMIELEDVNYFSINNLRLNWTAPRMITTEGVPRNMIVGGVESLFKINNSELIIYGDSSDQEQKINLIQMDGDSGVTLVGYKDDGQISDIKHGAIKVINPLPVIAKEITCSNVSLHTVRVDRLGADKTYIKQVNGTRNIINNAPHDTYQEYIDDVYARSAGLIKGNVYFNTTENALKVIN